MSWIMHIVSPVRLTDQCLKGNSTTCARGALATFESESAGKDQTLHFASAKSPQPFTKQIHQHTTPVNYSHRYAAAQALV